MRDCWYDFDTDGCSGKHLWVTRLEAGAILAILQTPASGGAALSLSLKMDAGIGVLINEGDDFGDRTVFPVRAGIRLGAEPTEGHWHGISPFLEGGLGVVVTDSWTITEDTIRPVISLGFGAYLLPATSSRRIQISYERVSIRNAFEGSSCSYLPPYECIDYKLSHVMHSFAVGFVL